MRAGELLLFLGGSGGLVALLIEGVRSFRGRNRERLELTEAVAKAPLVRQALELGNFDQAVKTLLAINTSQAAHIDRQDERIQELEADNERLRARVEHLEGVIERRQSPR